MATSPVASAQVWFGSTDVPRRGSVEASGGVTWAGGFDIANDPARLTANDGNSAPPFTLFTSDMTVKPIAGVQARGAFYLTRALAIEGGLRYSRPVVSAVISNDAEDAEGVTAEETMSRYVIDGSLVYHLRQLSFAGGRGMPFILGGAGYLRELHEGNELVETGTEYHGGGGIKVWFGGGKRRLGLRGDIGVSIFDGDFSTQDTRRTLPTAGASVMYLF